MRSGLNGFTFQDVAFIGDDGKPETLRLRDYAIDNVDAKVSIRFFNVIDAIAERIVRSDVVVGCSPWLTSAKIEKALEQVEAFSVIASYPDTKRAAVPEATNFPTELVRILETEDVDFAFEDWSKAQSVEYINVTSHSEQRSERLHSKFLVFFDREESGDLVAREIVMGSANLTNNADGHLETVVFVDSAAAAQAMTYNWYQMLIVAGYQRDRSLVRLGEMMTNLDAHNYQKAPWASWGLKTEDPWAMKDPDFFIINYPPK